MQKKQYAICRHDFANPAYGSGYGWRTGPAHIRFILPSRTEGLPRALVEAMARAASPQFAHLPGGRRFQWRWNGGFGSRLSVLPNWRAEHSVEQWGWHFPDGPASDTPQLRQSKQCGHRILQWGRPARPGGTLKQSHRQAHAAQEDFLSLRIPTEKEIPSNSWALPRQDGPVMPSSA
jgi:hypothetical protein